MTTLIFALSLAMLAPNAAQDPAPAQAAGTGTITGTVTSSAGDRPIPNATIRVVQWVGGLGRQSAARTDAQGAFALKNLVAGSYEITAQAEGHVTMRYGQRSLTDGARRIELADAQHFEDANIVLPKFTAIEGQLLDEFGDPMPGVRVTAAQVTFVAGKSRLLPAGIPQGVLPTDDRGVFRIYGLAPGDYYLTAVTGPFAGPDDPAGFAVTYFPGTKNPQDAKPVQLATGHDTSGVSFSLIPEPMFSLSGTVSDADGKPIGGNVALAMLSGGDIRSALTGRTFSGPDGRFTFRNVPSGSYVIQAFGRPAEGGGNLGRAPFGSATVELLGDRDDLRVTVKGARLSGRILFEGAAPPPPPDRTRIFPTPINFVTSPMGGGPPASTINSDWTFEVLNMTGQRVVRPVIGAPGWMLKRVTMAGKDVTDAPIDFSNGDVSDVEVTLTSNVGTITGTVSDASGPTAEPSIIAFADDAALWAFPSRYVAVGRPSSKGEFTISGLPSAWYLVAVAPPGLQPQSADPAVLEALRKSAVRVNVLEGGAVTVSLTIK
jgi:protocatechuate 3,4-dioxygenase beta subunit